MVALKEVQNMFWGVTLDGGKRYTQVVDHPFHISMAALEPKHNKKGGDGEKFCSVLIQHEKSEFLMCSLHQQKCFQQTLDLNFTEGEEVTFFLSGEGVVHLTGYLHEEVPPCDSFDEMEDDSEDSDYDPLRPVHPVGSDSDESDSEDEDISDEDVPKLKAIKATEDSDEESEDDDEVQFKATKRKLPMESGKKQKKQKVINEVDSDDDSDDIAGGKFWEEEDDDEDEDLDDEDEDLDDEEEEGDENSLLAQVEESDDDEEDMEEQPKPKKKGKDKKQNAKKGQQQTPKQEAATPTETSSKKKKKKKKKKKATENGEQTPVSTSKQNGAKAKPSTPASQKKQQDSQKKPKKIVRAGGTAIEDSKVGLGEEAKPGKMAHVYYCGKLQSGKQFDACQEGKPFRFKLGKGEVIKGWDSGVVGMKVGGKRRVTVPANQGYGSQRTGNIPANSTLVFDIELKAVT